ncbi:hypothetical protein AB0B06_30045 [Streptomyces sp. NPDC044989]|uniref:hypothetical protein n=1 Tax=Streptomyces sp. NPDC044989 TaxID=3154336 RepID=UPI0033F1AB54
MSGACALARSGHPEPSLVHPDGAVEYSKVAEGPGTPGPMLPGDVPGRSRRHASGPPERRRRTARRPHSPAGSLPG